jgi:hypothetical protein
VLKPIKYIGIDVWQVRIKHLFCWFRYEFYLYDAACDILLFLR